MKYSPLQPLSYVTSEASCSANSAYNPAKAFEPGEGQPAVSIVATRQQKPENFEGTCWSIEMTIAHTCKEGQNFPYTFKVSILGLFVFRGGEGAPADEEQFVRVNGSSMLYGAAREIVRGLTSRGPWPAIFLPGISFYERRQAQKPEVLEATPPLPPG